MTKWKSLAGKFTEDEIEIIANFQRNLGYNDNQFIRLSVELLLFYFGYLYKLTESNFVPQYDKEYHEIMQELSKYPELNAKIQSYLKNIEQHYDTAVRQITKESEPEIKKFTKKRIVGRPRSAKKKPGRPKDIGI